jgi:outer membrane protein insertion porin family
MVMSLINFVPTAGAQEAQIEGQQILHVDVIYESGKLATEKIPPLPLQSEKPFNFTDERDSLRALYRMGDYSDIRVTTTPEPGGIRATFIVKPNFYNNVIRIYGLKQPPTEPAASAALRLPLGEPFRESALREGVGRLQDTLRDNGFYLAKITWKLNPHEDTRQMDVEVNVDTGPRARADATKVENKTPYADQQLLRHAKITQKTEITAEGLSRASERLKKFLVNQGYLGAGVYISAGSYDAQSNRAPLNLSVTAGPRVRVEINGAHLSKSQTRRLLPIYAEGAVDEDLLQEGRRNIRDYLQRQGYFDAVVQVQSPEGGNGGERVISYDITRGDRFRLARVKFEGNHYFESQLLGRRLELQTAAFASSGRFSQQLLRDDTDSIRALYLSNGFLGAQVTSMVDDQYLGKKNNLSVAFTIVEGPQTRITSLQITGNHAISNQALLSVVGSTPGQPYSEAGVVSDRNNIMALYYDQGFASAQFHETISKTDNPTDLQLTYAITEGPRIEVTQVLTTGYQFTRPGIIRRQEEIRAGGPLRETDIANTQRQLYNLSVFNRVQIAPQNPDGSDTHKTVVVAVQEGDRYTIGYGGGFEVQRIAGGSSNPNGTTLGASPRGIFEISRNNMFGRAQTLTFQARASTLEYRFLTGYRASNFLNDRKLSLQFTAFADKTQDIDTFTSTRFEGGIQLVEKLSPSSSLLYSYFYRRVQATNINKTINPEEIPLLSQPTQVSGFEVTYARDRRDNPADPSHGTFNTLDFSDAIETIGSSADFTKVQFQNSSYYKLGRSWVFARSFRFGMERPYRNTVEPNDPKCIPDTTGAISCDTIPLPERLFAGGGTSLRGFALNQAGPRDPVTGFPVGGLASLIFNQELRFPMRLPLVGNRLGGTLFYDGGNVYTDISHISLAWKAPSLTDLNYSSNTVGFGLRYPTPIGPVRVDFGYQLNPASYQGENTTTGVSQVFRLPHFGFFFNIGPVF